MRSSNLLSYIKPFLFKTMARVGPGHVNPPNDTAKDLDGIVSEERRAIFTSSKTFIFRPVAHNPCVCCRPTVDRDPLDHFCFVKRRYIFAFIMEI